MTQELPIVPPKFGLNDSQARSEQPPGTTGRSRNTRTAQDTTGRLRVGSRCGYSRYNPEPVGRNWLAYSEDFSHYRDTLEGAMPWPVAEGWRIGVTGAKSFSATQDGTLAPDGASQAYLCQQLIASGAQRTEVVQDLDALDDTTRSTARPGASFLREAGKRLMFSVFMKAGTATQTLLALRQGNGASMAQNLLTITWTAGVPSIASSSVPSGNPYGFSDEGGGWYRVWAGITWSEGDEGDQAQAGSVLRCILRPNQASTAVAGTYFWGAQLELVPLGEEQPTRYEPCLARNDPTVGQRVTALTPVSHLLRKVDYVRNGAQLAAKSSTSTPAKQAAQAVAYDRQKNRYVLEAQSVVKFTPSGALVYAIPVPLDDTAHVCEALHVDETDQVYVGVTSGGDPKKAKLFCFRQGPKEEGGVVREDAWHLHWTVTTERYVVNVKSREGVLYTTQDDPTTQRSEVVVYSALDLSEPLVDTRWWIPYPSRGLALKSDGSVISCHGTNATRGLDPSAGASDLNGPWPTAVGWVPQRDFADWQQACWAYLDSEAIDGDALTTARYAQEDEVTEWVDLTGKGRNAYKPTGVSAPVVEMKGMNGIPGLRFRGAQGLQSNPNPGTDPSAKDLLRTILPSYDGAEFTAFVVFRPTFQATQGAVIGQALINDTSPAQDAYYVLGANRGASNTIANPVRGVVSLFDHADGTADVPPSFGNHPDDAMVESGDLVNFCVATLQCGTAANESQLRVIGALANRGAVGVRYASKSVAGSSATSIGYFAEASGFGSFDGVLFAVMVYDRLLSDADIELHEGYFANRYGGQGRLAVGHPYRIAPASSVEPGSNAPIATGKANVNQLNSRKTILAKYAPGGELKWTVVNHSGVGFDVAVDPSGNIISFGEYDAPESGAIYALTNRGQNGWLRKVIDNGDSADADDVVANWCQNLSRSGGTSVATLFSDAFWTKTNVTVGAGSGVDPFGATAHSLLTTTVAGGTVRHDFVAADLSEGLYTFSAYFKAGSAATSRITITANHAAPTGSTSVDVTHATGAITPTFSGTGRTHKFLSEDVGNGWRRVQVTLDWRTADSTLRVEIMPATTGTTTVSAYGAMAERNSRASTFAYSPTQRKDHEPPTNQFSVRPRIAVDKFGNVFVPGPWPVPTPSVTGRTVFSMRVYDSSMYLVHDLDVGTIAGNTLVPGRAVVVNDEVPEYASNNPGLARNLLGYTERFVETAQPLSLNGVGADYWTKQNVATTPANRIAPDGTVTADTLDDNSATLVGRIYRETDGLVDGEAYTFSVSLAPQDATTSRIVLEHATSGEFTALLVTWEAVSGRAPTVVRSVGGPGVHAHSVTPQDNGYFRLSVSATYRSALGALRVVIEPDATAANTGAVSAWGAQLELGAVATPYQAVAGSAALLPNAVPEPIGLVDFATLVTSNNDVVTSSNDATLHATLHELELVTARPNGLPARTQKLCGVRRGSVFVVDRLGLPQVPRGGASALDLAARYVSATSLYQRYIATDGKTSVIYQPAVDGRVVPFKATRGSVPEGVQLWASYRGRAFCARTEDDPHFWAASAIENVFDWDFYSPPLRSDMAVFSTTSRAGKAPDIINAIIPYRDQMLIVGCDSSIWYIVGDPVSQNAEWQLASEETGIAWGDKSSCISEDGTLYFFGSRGGLWTMSQGGPRPITTETIDRRLASVDLKRHYVELQWNWRAQGIHIFVIPFAAPTQIVKHYFYGLRHKDWREDVFADTTSEPTTSTVLDGDEPQDRRLLVANGAARVLQWDETATSDDGGLIDSEELIGPYANGDNDALWMEPSIVMSEDTTGARFEVYASSSANDPGVVKATGTLVAGRNPRKLARARGAKFWLLVGNNQPGKRWAFEEGVVRAADQGKAKLLT